jgi:hypothetical protein
MAYRRKPMLAQGVVYHVGKVSLGIMDMDIAQKHYIPSNTPGKTLAPDS